MQGQKELKKCWKVQYTFENEYRTTHVAFPTSSITADLIRHAEKVILRGVSTNEVEINGLQCLGPFSE